MALQYQNPVFPHDFADPFVLKTARGYYAYGTAASPDGKPFPVLHSPDLVHWNLLGGALEPLPAPDANSYWASEVAEYQGRFYLYYSAATTGSDDSHRLRVAIAQRPEGPFIDTGRILLPEAGFTIDASPFRAPATGQWYLFFATDYESEEPYGTGLAVAPLNDDMVSIAAPPVPVLRAQGDWQIYERDRPYKNKVWAKWNCVEGPSAWFHEGKYYLFYSGGAWHGDAYGVGCAVASHPLGPWKEEYAAAGPSVLKGIPGQVIGPGHNSCVVGPDGQTVFMVYHAWDAAKTARRMCIDPILWTPHGPKVDGPSTTPRTAPTASL